MIPKQCDKYLITTDAYFFAPDGNQYIAVWGTIKGVYSSKQTLGIETNAKSTNWYIVIGNMIIAGCQIHYAIKCDKVNFNPYIADIEYGGRMHKETCSITKIYNADL